jgi:hypothetical protein
MEKLYRYVDVLEQGITLRCDEWTIIKTTRCGYWIDYPGKPKFILINAYKKFAFESKLAAFHSYYKRKLSQIKILKNQLERAETALTLTPENPHSAPWSELFFND